MSECYAPANRYHGLSDHALDAIAVLTGAGHDDVLAAHKADIEQWRSEQELLDHPGLVSLNADLDRAVRRY